MSSFKRQVARNNNDTVGSQAAERKAAKLEELAKQSKRKLYELIAIIVGSIAMLIILGLIQHGLSTLMQILFVITIALLMSRAFTVVKDRRQIKDQMEMIEDPRKFKQEQEEKAAKNKK